MWKRIVLALTYSLLFSSVACGAEGRWHNFAEDSDVRYYLDTKSVVTKSGNVRIFWVKELPKNREFFRREYNLNDLSYLLTNVEIDCADATYRIRQRLMLDKNRKELSKTPAAASDAAFEPIPPESSLELAQESVCTPQEEGVETEQPQQEEKPQVTQPEETQKQGEPQLAAPSAEPEISLQ